MPSLPPRPSPLCVYLAGKLGTEIERKRLEELEKFCIKRGLKTFLPHRDVGIANEPADVLRIFEGDITQGLAKCNVVVACLDGLSIGAGTAWELGYAYAKKIPTIGIKMDEPVEDALEYLSSILIASMPIVRSLEELEKELEKLGG